MKTVFSKAVWAARAAVFTVGLAVALALILGAATAAIAAVPGDPFRLGKVNPINKWTKLVGQGQTPRLILQNNGSGVALRLLVKPGKPPMSVNSDTKVANLNADQLDGKNSTEFLSNGNHYRKVELRTGGLNDINYGHLFCNAGDKVLSGGYSLLSENGHVFGSEPALLANGWRVTWTGDVQIRMVVVCADLTP